jgi:hypothetical protein
MTIFKSNFSNKTPSPDNNNSQPECYFIIYKSPEFTLNCDGKDTMVELPVAPEQVYLYSNDPWWAANQHRIKQTIKCTDVSQRIDNNGSGSICVSSNNIKDCISITPDEEKLLYFIINNDCSAPPNNAISIWYNNILQTYPSLSGTKKLTRSLDGECVNCDNLNLVTDYLFTIQNASIVSGNNVTGIDSGATINLANYFDLNKRPIVSYSKSLSDNQDINIIISKQLGFNKAISIDEYSQVTTQDILPGQKLQLKGNMILGASSFGFPPSGTGTATLPVPPSLLSFRNADPEWGAPYSPATILTVVPTPKTPTEDQTVSYVFRFNGVAVAPSRIGPIVARNEEGNEFPGLSDNEYEIPGLFNEQYLTMASVSSNGVGEYSYPVYLGSGCCFVEDGTIISGSEETCQEYTTDRELSYTWSNITCPSSGSWLLGTKQNEIFYPTGCTYGSYDSWLASFGSGNVRNFYPNRACDNFPFTTEIINPIVMSTGTNINVTLSPSITINFASVSSTGELYFNSDFDNNTFSFTTTAVTSGSIGFSIPKPDSFVNGNELLSLSSNGSIISVPFNIVDDKIICSDISQNIEYYSPENGFTDLNSLSIKQQVVRDVQTVAMFYMAPSGVGSMLQYANYQASLWNSNYGYFTDSTGKINSYAPSIMSNTVEEIAGAQTIRSDIQDFFEFIDEPINFVPTLSFIPCENPFYVRGGFNLDDIWNEECGCWDIYLDRGELIYIVGTLIALAATALRLVKVGAGLTASLFQNTKDMDIQEAVAAISDKAIAQLEIETGRINDQIIDFIRENPGLIDFEDLDEIDIDVDDPGWPSDPRLDQLIEDLADKLRQKALEEDAQAKCNAEILRLFNEERDLLAQQDANNLTLAGVMASFAFIATIIAEWKKLPAITTRKTCSPGFDFCEWNGTYDACGGVEAERGYWKRGYSPDGVRLTMPQGWPSCDCCAPCEPCHNPPPDGENGVVCPACPEGWVSMGLKFVGFGDPSMTAPEIPDPDPCLNGETYVCCPPADAGSPFSNGPLWGAPLTEGGEWSNECVYFRPEPPWDWTTKPYREHKRCDDGDCIGYCD